jgi:L-lactate permease
MATLEEFGVLCQLNDQLFRLVRNMRQNAAQYTTLANQIDAGTAPAGMTAAKLGAIMKGDGQQFESRLATITALATRNQTLVSNALGIIGVTLASANATKNSLVTVAQHTQAATLTTTAQCRTEATFILDNTPGFDGAF